MKISWITAAIKKKTWKKKKHGKITKTKTNLSTIEVLISKAWIDSNIGHDEFDSVNDVLREYNNMKKAITNHGSIQTWLKYNKMNWIIVVLNA